jgi:argininosuccinate lyase
MRLLPRLVASLSLDEQKMAKAITPECFATDRAVELSAKGLPFRDAYRQVAKEIATLDAGDAPASLEARVSFGAPGNLALDQLERRLNA